MKTKKNIFHWILLAVFFAGGIYWMGHHFGLFYSHDHRALSALELKKNLYYCPMHPTYTSEQPGECPICHMSLVKFEDESSKRRPRPGGVPFLKNSPKKEFTLDQVMQMKPGEICLLHKCKHGQCKISMNEAIARGGKCPHCGEDFGILIKNRFPGGYSEVRLTSEKQELLGIQTEPVRISSLTKTIRAMGMVTMESTWLLDIRVHEDDLRVLKQGQAVDAELFFKVPLKMKAEIQGIGAFDPKTRTTRVRVSLKKALSRVSPGAEVDLGLQVQLGEALSVPQEAVFDTGSRQIVFVSAPDGHYEPREIKVGIRGGDFYQVVSGLAEGERVVTSGNFLIDSESRLKASLKNIAAGNGEHQHGA